MVLKRRHPEAAFAKRDMFILTMSAWSGKADSSSGERNNTPSLGMTIQETIAVAWVCVFDG
jgi:hypothetical protein